MSSNRNLHPEEDFQMSIYKSWSQFVLILFCCVPVQNVQKTFIILISFRSAQYVSHIGDGEQICFYHWCLPDVCLHHRALPNCTQEHSHRNNHHHIQARKLHHPVSIESKWVNWVWMTTSFLFWWLISCTHMFILGLYTFINTSSLESFAHMHLLYEWSHLWTSSLMLGSYFKYLPYITLGALAVVTAFVALFLPETYKQSLPETVQQMQEGKR